MREFNREKFRLAVFDLDDTTVVNGRMSSAVHDALCSLRKTGIETVAATARDRTQIDQYMSECFSYFITANGSCIESGESVSIYQNTIDRDTACRIIERIYKLGGRSFVYCNGHMIMSVGSLLRMISGRPLKDLIYNKSSNWDTCVTFNTKNRLRKSQRQVFKIGSCFKKNSSAFSASRSIASEFGVSTSVARNSNILEILSDGVSKDNALKKLCSHLGHDISRTIVFGDSYADVGMMKLCGFAVAMEDGDTQAINVSDIVSPSAKIDGVATVVADLFF